MSELDDLPTLYKGSFSHCGIEDVARPVTTQSAAQIIKPFKLLRNLWSTEPHYWLWRARVRAKHKCPCSICHNVFDHHIVQKADPKQIPWLANSRRTPKRTCVNFFRAKCPKTVSLTKFTTVQTFVMEMIKTDVTKAIALTADLQKAWEGVLKISGFWSVFLVGTRPLVLNFPDWASWRPHRARKGWNI